MSDEEKSKLDRSVLKLPFKSDEWVDRDEVMFHAAFAVLGEFVELELGTEAWYPEEDRDEMYRGYRLHSCDGCDNRAIDLWLWYRDELPKLEAEYTQDLEEVYSLPLETEPVGNELHRILVHRTREPKFPHDWPETVKEEKLRELLDLRRALWT